MGKVNATATSISVVDVKMRKMPRCSKLGYENWSLGRKRPRYAYFMEKNYTLLASEVAQWQPQILKGNQKIWFLAGISITAVDRTLTEHLKNKKKSE